MWPSLFSLLHSSDSLTQYYLFSQGTLPADKDLGIMKVTAVIKDYEEISKLVDLYNLVRSTL